MFCSQLGFDLPSHSCAVSEILSRSTILAIREVRTQHSVDLRKESWES